MALLHLLLEYPLRLGLAHVDHRWRKESSREAQSLQSLAAQLKLPFHLKTLDPASLKGNLEAACREERLTFFSELCHTHGYQAVLLGHHADDLAETVLKRTLEGVALPFLSCMRDVADYHGTKLWRPLLKVTKKQLATWLNERGLQGIDDATNNDPRFLRGKFRSKIIPWLSAEFGKEISPALCRLGSEAAELRTYLDGQIAPYLSQIIKGPFGSLLDLRESYPEAVCEIKHLIRTFCEHNGFTLSRDGLDTAAELFMAGAANKSVEGGDRFLHIDRKCLFILRRPVQLLPQGAIKLSYGLHQYGPWTVNVCDGKHEVSQKSDWKSLWQGEVSVCLPRGEYAIAAPDVKAKFGSTLSLNKWWTNHKIPSLLRHLAPVIYEEGMVRHEFLSGKRRMNMPEGAVGGMCIIKLAVEDE